MLWSVTHPWRAIRTSAAARHKAKCAAVSLSPQAEHLAAVAQGGLIEAKAVNAGMVPHYWRIGHRIRGEVLASKRAAYGKGILATLSQELTAEFGEGFSYAAIGRFAVKFEHVCYAMKTGILAMLQCTGLQNQAVGQAALAGLTAEPLQTMFRAILVEMLKNRMDADDIKIIGHIIKRFRELTQARNSIIHRMWFAGWSADPEEAVCAVIIHTKDHRWWGNLKCTVLENDANWHQQNGWHIVADDPVNNVAYPNIDRRVELEKEEPLDKEPLPIFMF